MLPREVLRQIRRLQLKARRVVDTLLGGEYHSVFKGSGIAFEEFRAYQPGDDIRSIDWNVTARTGQPFIKRFIEERELTLLLVLDCSGSLRFGSGHQQKREIAGELAAVLACSAISNNDRVGLMLATSEVETLVPPAKGNLHVLRLIRDVLYYQPRHRGTHLAGALDTINRVLRRRSIVFVLSDFADQNYEQAFRRVARRHDLIAVRIFDPLEENLPPVGLLQVEDAETGIPLLLDTSNPRIRHRYYQQSQTRRQAIQKLTASAGCDLIDVSTTGGHLEKLTQFFRTRERRQKRGLR